MKDDDKDQPEILEVSKLERTLSSQQFNVIRRVYQQNKLDIDADYHKRPRKSIPRSIKKAVKRFSCCDCIVKAFHILLWLPKYDPKKNLISDLSAGTTVAVLHIPQGMAYAMLAEVPPIVGLYMAFFPVLMYVIFGTSPHISIGTLAVACLMTGKVVGKYSPPVAEKIIYNSSVAYEQMHRVYHYTCYEVLGAVSFTVGLFQLIMWILRLGAVSTLLSEPLVSGITTAAAFQVLASQLNYFLGIRIPTSSQNFKVIIAIVDVCQNLPAANWTAVQLSIATCILMILNNELMKPWLIKKCPLQIPIEIIMIIAGTLMSKYWKLRDEYHLRIVGEIPTGLPAPILPALGLIPVIAVEALTITIITYTISMSMALIFANREKYEINSNQELLALGICNMFSSFFSCGPACASLSRSYVQYQAGAKTIMTSFICAVIILCVLLWIGPFFEDLPKCVLASIIMVSLRPMYVQVKELKKFWKLSKLDAAVWLITFLITVIIDIDFGLYAGLLASVAALFTRSQRPYTCLLGQVFNTDLYLDVNRYEAAVELPGIKLFHFCGGLSFATKSLFRSSFYHKIGYMKPHGPVTGEDHAGTETYEWDPTLPNRIHLVVIDASALTYIDAPGIKTLVEVHKELQTNHIKFLLAGPDAPVLEMIERYNNLHTDGLHLETFPTVHDAVMYFKITEANRAKVLPQDDNRLLEVPEKKE